MIQMSLLELVHCWADADDSSGVWMIVFMCVCGTQQTSSWHGKDRNFNWVKTGILGRGLFSKKIEFWCKFHVIWYSFHFDGTSWCGNKLLNTSIFYIGSTTIRKAVNGLCRRIELFLDEIYCLLFNLTNKGNKMVKILRQDVQRVLNKINAGNYIHNNRMEWALALVQVVSQNFILY